MFGIILFWIHYIIAVVLLYHILRCIYVKGEHYKNSYRTEYKITDSDERLKHPLYAIILFILVLFIPVANLMVYVGCIFRYLVTDGDQDHNKYYCKSFLTKKY